MFDTRECRIGLEARKKNTLAVTLYCRLIVRDVDNIEGIETMKV